MSKYCNLKIEDLNITEYLGKKGVWLSKTYMGIPYFCTIDALNDKMLKLIESGYFKQVPKPHNIEMYEAYETYDEEDLKDGK